MNSLPSSALFILYVTGLAGAVLGTFAAPVGQATSTATVKTHEPTKSTSTKPPPRLRYIFAQKSAVNFLQPKRNPSPRDSRLTKEGTPIVSQLKREQTGINKT